MEIAEGGGIGVNRSITVRNIVGEKYDRIVAYELGPMPEAIEIGVDQSLDFEETPF